MDDHSHFLSPYYYIDRIHIRYLSLWQTVADCGSYTRARICTRVSINMPSSVMLKSLEIVTNVTETWVTSGVQNVLPYLGIHIFLPPIAEQGGLLVTKWLSESSAYQP